MNVSCAIEQTHMLYSVWCVLCHRINAFALQCLVCLAPSNKRICSAVSGVSCAIEQTHMLCSVWCVLCHRINAFALQCLVSKFTQTSSLINTQPAIKLYQNVLSGTTFDVEAEFALRQAKCISGSISADNAFDAVECCLFVRFSVCVL